MAWAAAEPLSSPQGDYAHFCYVFFDLSILISLASFESFIASKFAMNAPMASNE